MIPFNLADFASYAWAYLQTHPFAQILMAFVALVIWVELGLWIARIVAARAEGQAHRLASLAQAQEDAETYVRHGRPVWIEDESDEHGGAA